MSFNKVRFLASLGMTGVSYFPTPSKERGIANARFLLSLI